MKKMITVIACALALVLMLTACGQAAAPIAPTVPATPTEPAPVQSLANGGVLVLSVNPEIAVEYDAAGTVTGVTARNNDALAIINSCTDLIGRPTRNVVSDLVTAIGNAGYFVEEVDGTSRQITLEIEPGSSLPSGTFLDDVITDIRTTVQNHDWTTPLNVEIGGNNGTTTYVDTDYGPGSDGVTDFGKTDYDDTDYGPNNDGVTDFGKTDYDDTDYGPNNDGVTDYVPTEPTTSNNTTGNKTTGSKKSTSSKKNNTDYGDTDYGKTDYGKSDYGKSDYDKGKTDYGKTDYDKDSKYD